MVRIKVGSHGFRPFDGSLKVFPCELIRALCEEKAFRSAAGAVPSICWSVHVLAHADDEPSRDNAVQFDQPIAGLIPSDCMEVFLALVNNFPRTGPLEGMTECASSSCAVSHMQCCHLLLLA